MSTDPPQESYTPKWGFNATLAFLAALLAIVAGGGYAAFKSYTVTEGDLAARFPALPRGELGPLLEELRAAHRLPALAAAVGSSAGPLALGTAGVRKAGTKTAVELGDPFHLGDCTKAMTATVAAALIEDGEIAWQSTVPEIFPELSERLHPHFHGATLEQFLRHRAGLPDDRRPDVFFRRLHRLEGSLTARRIALTERLLATRPAAAPGLRMQYSHYGYVIAGAMLERVAKKPWETLIEERLFAPLGMTSAGFGAPGSPGILDAPWGHRRVLGSYFPVSPGPAADHPPAVGPSSRIHAPIGDFLRFALLHLRARRGKPELLSAASFATLHADPHQQGYAMGWSLAEPKWAGEETLMHAGSNNRFMAATWIVPRRDLAIVVATNLGEGTFAACEATAAAIWQRYAGGEPGASEDGSVPGGAR